MLRCCFPLGIFRGTAYPPPLPPRGEVPGPKEFQKHFSNSFVSIVYENLYKIKKWKWLIFKPKEENQTVLILRNCFSFKPQKCVFVGCLSCSNCLIPLSNIFIIIR